MTTLYEKRGRRYYPVAEERRWDAFTKGAHLVVCTPGFQTTRHNIDLDHAGLLAAAEPLREQITKLVMEKLSMRPSKRPVTQQQLEAWEAFRSAMGNDGYIVEYLSAAELADAVVELIVGAK